MRQMKLTKKQIENLQNSADEYKQKTGFGWKIITGIMVGLATLSLVGCAEGGEIINDKNNEVIQNNTYAEKEQNMEKELQKFLEEKTGLTIHLVNIKDVKLTQGDEKFLIISGEIIEELKFGFKECNIILKISEEQASLAEKFLTISDKYISMTSNYGEGFGLNELSLNTDIAALKYSQDFIKGMEILIDDQYTEIVSIVDKDNNEFIFDNQELTQ